MEEVSKNSPLKFYEKIIPIISIPTFIFFFFPYSYLLFATITNRSGLWGSYGLTKFQFSIYLLIVIYTIIWSVFYQVKYPIEDNILNLRKTFRKTGILIVLILILTMYLEYSFVGKP